jgi:hypothetical protein
MAPRVLTLHVFWLPAHSFSARLAPLRKFPQEAFKGVWTANKRKFDQKHPGAGNSKFLTVINSIPRHAGVKRVDKHPRKSFPYKLAEA